MPSTIRRTTADGVELAVHTRWAASPRACVVVAHGFSASASHADVVALTSTLHAADLDVVSYDARGHGESTGACTLGNEERSDVSIAVDVARTRRRPIVLVGMSMGAIAALGHAVESSGITGVVTVSCPARWTLPRNPRGVLSACLVHTSAGRRLSARRLGVRVARPGPRGPAPMVLAARLTVPLAIVHGAGDPFIPSANATLLHDAAVSPVALHVVPGRWHAYDPRAEPVIVGAIDWVLQATASS